MNVKWTSKGNSDFVRLHEFLVSVNPRAAAKAVRALVAAAGRLPDHPRIGEKLEQYEPLEVRRVLIGDYEMRYEIRDSTI
ncbi:MAG: type II toxin-antitoxin system RelE/ParE family toxin [Methylocella sp.]